MNPTDVRRQLEEKRTELEELRRATAEEVEISEPQIEGAGDLSMPTADAATDTFERERSVSVVTTLEVRIAEVEDALRRLEEGRYGICEVCGTEIPKARLKARPDARYCVEHQQEAERH